MKLTPKQLRGIDFLIAERFMGWSYMTDEATPWWNVPEGDETRDEFGSADAPPCYSTDERYTLMVLRKWTGDVNIRRQNGLWKVELFQPSQQWEEWAETFGTYTVETPSRRESIERK